MTDTEKHDDSATIGGTVRAVGGTQTEWGDFRAQPDGPVLVGVDRRKDCRGRLDHQDGGAMAWSHAVLFKNGPDEKTIPEAGRGSLWEAT